MRTYTAITLALFLASCQSSQTPRYVITEGSATVRVPIEEIKVGISVNSKGRTLGQANQENRASVPRIFETFRQFGITDSDFVTDRSSASIETRGKDDSEQPSVIYAGTLTLRDPSRYDEVLKALTDVGGVEVGVAGYANLHLETYRAQAYNEAFNAAKKEAELLLAPSGGSVGKVLKVLKNGYDPFDRYDNADKEMERGKGNVAYSVAAPTIPNFEKIFRRKYFEVSQEATVMFEIE